MNNSSIITLTDDASFEKDVLKSELPVLVDFWAKWCGPCQMLTPILEEYANENIGKIKICKLNVDENSAIATKYGIRSIPVLILFKAGAAVATKVGVLPKSQLEAFLKGYLA